MSGFHGFPRDDRGSTAVEFALLASGFLVLMLGIVESALALFTAGTIESAVLNASRYGITGQSETGLGREAAIINVVNERLGGLKVLFDPSSLKITSRVYRSFAEVGHDEPFTDGNDNADHDAGEGFEDTNGNGVWDGGQQGVGGPNDIVLYEIQYKTKAITPLLQPIFGQIDHRASVVVRNEPY